MHRIIFLYFLFCSNFSFGVSWPEKTLEQMSLDEKIGQLFIVAAYVDPEYACKETGISEMTQEIEKYITQYHVGGLAYVGPSEVIKQVILTNHYQTLSKYPLLIAQDLEWGLSMRVKDGMNFPKNSTLGAISNTNLIYEMGKEIGRQAKAIGVHMNLSPVLDIDNQPNNIAINVRSFGLSAKNVAEKGVAMIQGLQESGIIASAKHFPGLGDITIDPHFGLPYNRRSKEELKEWELYPFMEAIKAGVLSIQVEHLMAPGLEPKPIPTSLSYNAIENVLKKELGFKGLILSGALRMGALTKNFSEEEIVVGAFCAGNDMLLMPLDLPKAHYLLKEALLCGKINESELNKRVLKILQMKCDLQLDQKKIIPIPAIETLHTAEAKKLKKELYQEAVAFVRSGPLSIKNNISIPYIQFGGESESIFFKALSQQFSLDPLISSLECSDQKKEEILTCLKHSSVAFLAIYPLDPRRIEQIRLLNENRRKEALKDFRVYGMPITLLELIDQLHDYKDKIILVFFGNPFGLSFFEQFPTLLMAYETDPDAQEAAACMIQEQIGQSKGS